LAACASAEGAKTSEQARAAAGTNTLRFMDDLPRLRVGATQLS
jgi:hypothetical protein